LNSSSDCILNILLAISIAANIQHQTAKAFKQKETSK